MQHTPVRRWWRPWRRQCRCGVEWFPCPDTQTQTDPSSSDQTSQIDRTSKDPTWNAPTRYLPPLVDPPDVTTRSLLTPGQLWRSQQAGKWPR